MKDETWKKVNDDIYNNNSNNNNNNNNNNKTAVKELNTHTYDKKERKSHYKPR